jgi:general nucleoside transport system permease protein
VTELIEAGALAGFLAAAIRVATPLLLAALGETIAERAGVINLGIEGAMLAGALAAAIGSVTVGPWGGFAAGLLAGTALAGVFAAVAIGGRADQIITGTAVTLGAVGLTGAASRWWFGAAGAGLGVPTLPSVPVPGLVSIPIIGPAVFDHPPPTYIAVALVPVVAWVLFRTRAGLALRAAGEAPGTAHALGVRVRLVRTVAVLLGGACAGLAGATLVLAQVGTFAERMTGGRGFVAIAIVVLGRWHPAGVLIASLLFGGLTALQYLFQALGLDVPYQLFLMMPYVLTLVALAGVVGRARPPAGLAREL